MQTIAFLVSNLILSLADTNRWEHPVLFSWLSASVIIAITVMIYMLLRYVFEPILDRISRKTPVKWDDILCRHTFLRWVWALVAALICVKSIPAVLNYSKIVNSSATVAMQVVLLLSIMMVLIESVKSAFLLIADRENVETIAKKMRMAQDNGEEFIYKPSHSLKGLQQMLILIVIFITIILITSILLHKNPVAILTGLSAGAALLMLIFRDSILGVVAGVQLTANDMVQPGDWITVPKFGANGIVQEVTLATVKVQNWDKTIVTIPPYSLISDAFQNWRGMQDCEGRRIMRAVNIDMTTIRPCSPEELAEIATLPGMDFVEPDCDTPNVSLFRTYLEKYIASQPTFRANLLNMVRELPPTAEGLPVEVYFFTSCTEWKKYEKVQADVMDHIITILPRFGLKIFQKISGADIVSPKGK